MIISIKGKITRKEANFLIIENAGISYQIFFAHPDKVALGSEQVIFTHEYLREDRRELYGFLTFEELEFFLKLLAISGIGPKLAQNITSLGQEKIQKAVLEGNTSLLEGIPGVGKKTAQKIILELRGSIEKILKNPQVNRDALSALISLGYLRSEAEEALRQIDEETAGAEAQVKAALKMLGRK